VDTEEWLLLEAKYLALTDGRSEGMLSIIRCRIFVFQFAIQKYED
jgi:hypothetical protein